MFKTPQINIDQDLPVHIIQIWFRTIKTNIITDDKY